MKNLRVLLRIAAMLLPSLVFGVSRPTPLETKPLIQIGVEVVEVDERKTQTWDSNG